jgi:photosystem II stability/assembly factor-like uncharacterized protein
MKIFRQAFTFFLLISQICSAQWSQIGPKGGSVTGLAVNGTSIFAATYGGALVSTDFGFDWSHSSWGLLHGDIRSIVATSSKVFIGTYANGIYMKDLNGLIWEQTSFNNQTITSLAAIGTNVFAGTYSTGVYLSTDNGATWNQKVNGMIGLQVECLTVSGTTIFAGTATNIYKSTDMGNTWTSIHNGLAYNTIISLAVNGTSIYAGVWANGIYVSTNNGADWSKFGATPPSNYVYSFAFNGSAVYAAAGKIWRTTDDGTSWADISGNIPLGTQIQALAFLGGNLVAGDNAVNGSTGIYVSTNEGTNWTSINWGLPNYCANSIVAKNGGIFTGTSGSLFRSINEGASWNNPTIHIDYDWTDVSALAFRGNEFVFAGDVNSYVYLSTDAGLNFYQAPKIEKGASVSSFAFIGYTVFAGVKPFAASAVGGVYKSLNNGSTWQSVNTGLPSANLSVSSLAVIGSNLFAGTGQGVFLSTNSGTNWSQVNNGLTGQYVYALAVRDTDLFAGTIGQGVFRSTDKGTTWTHTSLVKDVTALIVVDTSLFAGTWSQGVYRMSNIDLSWKSVGLPGVYVTGFAADNGNLYAATMSNSIWKSSISQLTDVNETNNNTPGEFALSQNYPNPFNPTTTINYSVFKSGEVVLKVYNIMGKEIITLVNEQKPAGNYSVKFDAGKLTSGVYFYQLKSGDFISTKKLILLK